MENLFPLTKAVDEAKISQLLLSLLSDNTHRLLNPTCISYSHLSHIREFILHWRNTYCPTTSYSERTRCSMQIIDVKGKYPCNALSLSRKLGQFTKIISLVNSESEAKALETIYKCYNIPMSGYQIVHETLFDLIHSNRYDSEFYGAAIYIDYASGHETNSEEEILSFVQLLLNKNTSCCMVVLKVKSEVLIHLPKSLAKYIVVEERIHTEFKLIAFCGKPEVTQLISRPSVGNQIQILYRSPHSHVYQRFMQIIQKQFYGKKKELNLFLDMFHKIMYETPNAHDETIYDLLRDHFHRLVTRKSEVENTGRSDSRACEIKNLLLLQPSAEIESKDFRILDIGCSQGLITESIGWELKLDESQVYGCDVRPLQQKRKFQFQLVKDSEPLPYESNTFNVITALMSLHHIETIELTLKEVNRLLKPGGVFIIREHDLFTPELEIVLDVMHGLYTRVWSNPPEQYSFCDNFFAQYRSKNEWTQMIETLAKLKQAPNSPDHVNHYKNPKTTAESSNSPFIKNPFAFYSGVYVKESVTPGKKNK